MHHKFDDLRVLNIQYDSIFLIFNRWGNNSDSFRCNANLKEIKKKIYENKFHNISSGI